MRWADREAVVSGSRVSELIGLKFEDVHSNALTVDERYCRGDWNRTKTTRSAATVGVPDSVIARIQRPKTLEAILFLDITMAKQMCSPGLNTAMWAD